MKMINNLKKVAAFSCIIFLASCGQGGSCNTSGSSGSLGQLSLALTAPNQYPAGIPVTAYLTITNTSQVNATNLTYTVPSATNYTGVNITVDPNGAGQGCANINAGASCTFTANIPAGSHPGNFTVNAVSNGTFNQSVKNSIKSMVGATPVTLSLTANIGLVDVPNTLNRLYVLPSTQTVQSNENSITNVMLSVLVKNAGTSFNKIKLVDNNGSELNATLVGQAPATYSVNNVLTFNVAIPANVSLQNAQAMAYNNNTPVCDLNNGSNDSSACSNRAEINFVQQGVGILQVAPTLANMSASYTNQVVTLSNIGSAPITSLSIPPLLSPFNLLANSNNCTESLGVGQSCNFTAVYAPGSVSGQSTLLFSYNNSQQTVTTPATLVYTGTTPQPYAIITANPNVVYLDENNLVETIILTNTGTANATSLTMPALPSGFTSTTDCNATLALQDNCTYTINYNIGNTNGSFIASFDYYDGTQSQTTNVTVNYTGLATPPSFSSVVPVNASTNVSPTQNIKITFSQPMNLSTLIPANFELAPVLGGAPITLINPSYSVDHKTVTFGTMIPLASNTQYKISIPNPNSVTSGGGSLNLPSATYPNGVISQFTTATYNSGACNGGFAFILNQANNSVTKCSVISIGGLTNCSSVNTPVAGLNTPVAGIANRNYPYQAYYIANKGNNSVGTYDFTSFLNASIATGIINQPIGIASSTGNPIYVANANGTLVKCLSAGSNPYALQSCNQPTQPLGFPDSPAGFGVLNLPSTSMYYSAAVSSNTVMKCGDPGNSGLIASCSDAGGSNFNQPVTFTGKGPSSPYLLVGNAGDNTITRCDVDSITGDLSNCIKTGGNIDDPSSIYVYRSSAYITNKGDNTVTVCKNSAGVLTECNKMDYGFSLPVGITAFDTCD